MEDIGVYINLFTDFGFKKIFGTESNKDLLIHFLNTVLENEITPIVEVEFANGEFLGNFPEDRKAIFDIYCKTDKGERFIIELQRAEQSFFKDRSVFYATFPIQEQAKKGNWTFELMPVYTVCIMDFVFDEQSPDEVVRHVQLREKDSKEVFFDKLKFVYIEMPKFLKTEGELQTLLDKWLYFFKHIHELKNLPAPAQERVFLKLFHECEIQNFPPQEAMKYKESWKEYNDFRNIMDFAKTKAEEKGKMEQAQYTAVYLIKNTAMPNNEIGVAVDLSEEQIADLRQKVTKGLL